MGLRSQGGGCVIQLVPRFLHQREADRSISLRHLGCAGLVHAQKILAAHHSCCWFKLNVVFLAKILLRMNKPRNFCITNTERFLLKYPLPSSKNYRIYTKSGWMRRVCGLMQMESRASCLTWQASDVRSNASKLVPCFEDAVPPLKLHTDRPFRAVSTALSLSLLPVGNL